MPRALISVYDKTGIVEFAVALIELGWDVVASDANAGVLRENGVAVISVTELTNNAPETLPGDMKGLQPAIYAGILAGDTPTDIDFLNQMGYAPIKMVVSNLSPFQEMVGRAGATLQDAIEQIDVGGATLLRAAAKNFFHVLVVCDVNDYGRVLTALRASGDADLALKRNLAVKAFAHVRDYDTAIHAYLSRGTTTGMEAITDAFPVHLSLAVQRTEMLRYGENPHQKAAYYSYQSSSGVLGGTLVGGQQLSYTNILDLDVAWRAVGSFSDPTVVFAKHLVVTGIASAASIVEAYPRALASDPVTSSGGMVAVNRPVDTPFVAGLGPLFLEAIAAPLFSDAARQLLHERRKNCSLLQIPYSTGAGEFEIRSVQGGVVVQRANMGNPEDTVLKTVTVRAPSVRELEALQLAWKAVRHVRSNAIVLAVPGATVGIGGGLPSRLDALNLAILKAGERANGAVLASDGFFAFAEEIQLAVEAGVTAIIQPGGSIRDGEIIEVADRAEIAMVVTGTRHFRH